MAYTSTTKCSHTGRVATPHPAAPVAHLDTDDQPEHAMADKVLDARNLNCPLPILKTKRALSDVAPGGTLEVLATDPGSPDDFVAFADSTGNTLLQQSQDNKGVFHFLIRRES
jgi:tRNA 2-thiouridine synthesizing protein A